VSLISDPESSLKPEEPNKKETTNREASSEDTKSQQQASTLEGFCNDVVCAYFINHYAAIFFVGCLIVWFD
jgi:hypothetical protein